MPELEDKIRKAKEQGVSYEDASALMHNQEQIDMVSRTYGKSEEAPVEDIQEAPVSSSEPIAEGDPYAGLFIPDDAGTEAPAEAESDPYAGLFVEDESVENINIPDSFSTALSAPTGDPEEFKSWLPTNLNIAGFETDIELSPEMAASLVGLGHGMLDTYRGLKQMLPESIVGAEEKEAMAETEKAMNLLYGSDGLGSFATGGMIAGMITDPVGVFIPVAKGATLAKSAAIGAGLGATFGGLGYVDEAEGETRLGNAMIGAALGGVIGGAIKGVPTLTKAASSKVKERMANSVIDKYEFDYVKQIASGKTPQQVKEALLAKDPKLGTKIKRAFNETNRIPHTLVSRDEALQLVAQQRSTRKPIDIALGTVGDTAKAAMKGIDTIGGVVSTRVKKISEPVFHRLRTYEYNTRVRTHQYNTRTDNFVEKLHKLSDMQQQRIGKALANSDFNTVNRVFKSSFGDEGVEVINDVVSVLEEIGKDAYKHQRISGRIKDYFPRIITDRKGLLKAMDKESFNNIRKEMTDMSKKLDRPLTALEESDIINKKILRPYSGMEARPGHGKARGFKEIPPEFLQFYAKPEESLHTYINNAIMDIEKAKFFGKGYRTGKDNAIDITGSVGNLMRDEIKSGDLTQTQFDELSKLLETRFSIGERPAHKAIQDIKNIMYAGLLGNPISAITQLGDIGASMYVNGMLPTLKAVTKTLTGKTSVKVKDLGLVDKLSEEFVGTGWTSKLLNKSLRYGLFEGVDRLGKSTLINSALSKYQKAFKKNDAKTMAKFAEKYQNVFGDEYAELTDALAKGDITENVKLMLFNELSDIQPISLSEMPQAYLQHPNGRIFYMFKSFMLKQLDIVRRDSYDKIKKGNVREGLQNLMLYGAFIGAGNTGSQYTKDWILGKDVEPEAIDIPINMLKTLGWSEFTAKKAKEGKVAEAAIGYITPPVNIFDQMMQDPVKGMQFAPIAGRLWYMYFGGGIEDYQSKKRGEGMFEGNGGLFDKLGLGSKDTGLGF